MNEPLNIYEMLDWIRKFDNSPCGRLTWTADFLLNQYAVGRISSEDVWNMLRELMTSVLANASYIHTES